MTALLPDMLEKFRWIHEDEAFDSMRGRPVVLQFEGILRGVTSMALDTARDVLVLTVEDRSPVEVQYGTDGLALSIGGHSVGVVAEGQVDAIAAITVLEDMWEAIFRESWRVSLGRKPHLINCRK